MKTQIQLLWGDYLAASYLNLRPRPLFATLGALLLLLGVWAAARDLSRAGGGRDALIILAAFAYLGASFFVYLPLKIRRIYRQQRSLQVASELDFGGQGITVTSEMGLARLAWDDFVKWKENRRLIVLYTSDVMMHIYPRRCFTDEGWAAFRQTVAAHVKKRKNG